MLCFFILLQSRLLHAEPLVDEVKIGLAQLPGVLSFEEDNAPYNKLLKTLINSLPFKVTVDYYPTARLNLLLNTSKLDCIFPIAKGEYVRPIPTINSQPINTISMHLFTLTPPALVKLEQIDGKILTYPRGYLFSNLLLNSNAMKMPVSSPSSAIGAMEKGRADAYLNYLPDLKFMLSSKEFGRLIFDKNKSLRTVSDVFECIDNSKNNTAISLINSELVKLKESGELKRILGTYYNLD
jgi:ABC-type amino acid transport substrate-binding protein